MKYLILLLTITVVVLIIYLLQKRKTKEQPTDPDPWKELFDRIDNNSVDDHKQSRPEQTEEKLCA